MKKKKHKRHPNDPTFKKIIPFLREVTNDFPNLLPMTGYDWLKQIQGFSGVSQLLGVDTLLVGQKGQKLHQNVHF
jgi:NADH:ubiquinone oxidoreductase subunit C